MFINKTNIKLLAAALLTALAAPSCMNLDETREGGYGYLTISGLDLDVQVEQLVPTKGADGETTVDISNMISEENRPKLSEVTVTPKNPQEGQPNSYTYQVGDVCKLPEGVYTLSAVYGDNKFGTPWFEGTGEVEVKSLDSVVGKVTFTLANSVMKVTNGMTDHFTVANGTDVTISSNDEDLSVKSVTTKMNNNTTDYVFVPSGKALNVKVTGSNTAGGESKEYSVEITADKIQKGYAHNVILSVDEDSLPSVNFGESNVVAWGNAIFITSPATATSTSTYVDIDMSKVKYYAREEGTSSWTHQAENNIISGLESDKKYEVMASIGALSSVPFTPSVNNIIASAKHTDTNGDAPGGDLNGTDLTIDEASIPSNVRSNCTFTLKKSDGSDIRSFDSSHFVGATATDGWPYLPQGKYTLIAKVNGTEISSMTSIKVPAPEFGVTFKNAYTSYDKYTGSNGIAQNITDANNCDPDMLKGSGVTCSISNNLISNSNYSKSFKVHKEDGTVIGNTKSDIEVNDFTHDIDGLSWTSYKVANSFTFDGVTKTSEYKTHHITGLPYSYNFVDGSLDAYRADGWTTNGQLRVSNIALLGRPKALVLQHQSAFGADKQNGYVVSPKFHVPSTISIQPSVHRSTYTSAGNKERTGFIGAVSNVNSSNTSSVTYTTKGGISTGGTIYGKDENGKNEWLKAFQLSTTDCYISIDSDDWPNGGWDAVYYFLHEVHLRYAQ